MQGNNKSPPKGHPYRRWGVEYREHTGPPEKPEQPVCTRSLLCEGCPFPGHGFLCWNDSGDCMKTRFDKLKEVK